MRNVYLFYFVWLVALLTSSGTVIAQIQKIPKIEVIAPDCAPAVVSMYNLSHTMFDTTNIKYRWYKDQDPQPFYSGYRPSPMNFNAGPHNIRVESDSSGKFMGSAYYNFNIRQKPTLFMPANNSQFCPGDEIPFRIEDEIYNMEWDFGDNAAFDPNKYNNWTRHTYKTAGTYNVKVRYNHACGSDSIKQTIVISPSAVPSVVARVQGSNQVCLNDAVLFETSENYSTYNWSFGDGSSSTLPRPSHAYSTLQNFPVILTAKNICGQTGKDTVFVNVAQNMPAYAGFDIWTNKNNCPMSPISFYAQGTGNYMWSFGDGATSTLRSPTNVYGDTGTFKVQLILTNGCGRSDTSSKFVMIRNDFNMMPPQPNINLRRIYDSDNQYIDTLKICVGEKIIFENNSWDDGSSYRWEMGDGTILNIKNGQYAYKANGVYILKLTLKNNCGGTSSASRLIKVTSILKPLVRLKAIPRDICPGERVFFFDNMGKSDILPYLYNIDFGDGIKLNNIDKQTDTIYETLATHVYTNASVYTFKFIAVNACGNKDSLVGTINVNTTPKIPFYYVNNSTNPDDRQIQDWSVRKSPLDSKFIIPVSWNAWPGIDSTLTAFFFWGKFDPNQMDGNDPAGKVSIRIKHIINNLQDTIIAFVPHDLTRSDSVGLAVGWYCNSKISDGEPDAFSMLMSGLNPVKALKVVPAGIVNTGSLYPPGVVFPDNAFSGTCKMSARGNWLFKVSEGNYYLLNIYDSGYDLQQSSEPGYSSSSMYKVSSGNSWTSNDTISFMDSGCGTNGRYKFFTTGDKITFVPVQDDCDNRFKALSNKNYTYFVQKEDNNRTGCPGDPVKFMIAGGISHQWTFGDGSPAVTGPIVYHAYADTGIFIAKAIVTNACGRIDTIRSIVTIKQSNLPNAQFDLDRYWAMKGDTIRTKYWGYNDRDIDNNHYLWDFGDGTTSTIRNAAHVYQSKGSYNIKLTVTNGCGANMASRHTEIGGLYDQCTLSAKFGLQKADTAKLYPGVPVKFLNLTYGSATKFTWNFGDGAIESTENPSHNYSKGGMYNVCLSVYDDSTKCTSQSCMDILVGELGCNADFSFAVNATTNTVNFYNKSFKATKWYWNFGDSKFDTTSNPVHLFSKPGLYQVCLNTYDKLSNCQSQKCMQIEVGAIDSSKYCKAEYSYFVDNSSLEVRFKNQSIGNIVRGYWNFGDGYLGYEENPIHKYTKPGLYKVCGSIVDSSGCQSEVCKEIQVGVVPCKANYTYFMDPQTREVKFTGNALGSNLKYFWSFGDGKNSTSANPVNKYMNAGVYNVCMVIKDSVSRCQSDFCTNITVGDVKCFADFNFTMEPATRKVKFVMSSDTMVARQWNFGDGYMDSIANPVHSYTKDGIFTVCLNVYNKQLNCYANRCATITVNPQSNQPLLDADFSFITDATTRKALFTNKSTGKAKKFYWNFGDGTTDTAANPIHTYLKPGLYPVCLWITDSARNVSQECKELNINGNYCKAEFNFFAKTDGLSVQLNDASSGAIKEHYWDLGNGLFSNKKDFLASYTAPGIYKICKSIVDSTGCKASVCKEIQVGVLACKAAFNFYVDSVLKVVFADQSIGNANSYFWDFGEGSFSNLKNPAHWYAKAGTYIVTLIAKNTANNCISETKQEVQAGNVSCAADFSYSVEALTRTVTLLNTSKGDLKRFYWENGIGATDTLESTKFVYANSGNYKVCLSVFNPLTNCRSSVCKTITVIKDTSNLQRFAADFSYFVVIDSSKIVLTDKSTGDPNLWYWTFGNGDYAKAKNTSYIYTKPGLYKVCHSIYKTTTGQFDETCKEVLIGAEPCSLAAGYTKYIDTKTQMVYLSDNSSGKPNKWFWLFGDGTSAQSQNPVHIYTKPGYYLVSLAIRDTIKKCTSYFGDIIQVGTVSCKADFNYSVDMTTNKLTLQNTSSGNVSKYYWEFGDRSNSIETSPEHTYDDAGMYKITLVAASSDVSCKDYKYEAIQVGTINCSADFEYYVDSASRMVYFKNKSLGTSTKYLWMFGDGTMSSLASPMHKYVAPGYFKVGLNTYNPVNGCMDYAEKIILVGSEGIDCQADFIYQANDATKEVKFFNNSAGNELKYRWNFGDQTPMDTAANPSHTYTVGGFYNTCLTIFAKNGVQNTACKMIKIAPDVQRSCLADFIFDIDSVTRTVNFTDKSTGGIDKWYWDFGDTHTSALSNPSNAYAAKGYYNVKFFVKNTLTGCNSATAKMINVSEAAAFKGSFTYGLDTVKLKTAGTYPITFVGLSTGDVSKFVWDFGDNAKDSTTTSPTHVYTQSGLYNVCLTVSDPVTSQLNKYCSQVLVGQSTQSIFDMNDKGIALNAFPNPFNQALTITFDLPESGNFELLLTDVKGRAVNSILKGTRSAGSFTETWTITKLKNGVYYLQLKLKGKTIAITEVVKIE